MTDAASPYLEVRNLVEELTLGMGELARELLAEARAEKDLAKKRELSHDVERLCRSVRTGAAYLVRIDEAAARIGKLRAEREIMVRPERIQARKQRAHAALVDVPIDIRLPHLDRLRKLADDLTLSDEAFGAEIARVVQAFAPAARPPGEAAPARTQSEIMAAALAAKRAGPAPPLRTPG